MAWTFEQSTGHLYDPSGTFVAACYSGGDCGHNPDTVNNPDSQTIHGGTIPQGVYDRGQVVEGSHLGAFAIQLLPTTQAMFGRSGFFIHGDNQACDRTASEGCIIAPRDAREQFHASNDAQLEVVGVKIG